MPAKVTSTGLYIIPNRKAVLQKHTLSSAEIDALPAVPGVYLFLDARRRPLYIGKSVNIRHRVAQHLRDPGQADMLALARRVKVIETAGELGALLQELVLVRKHQPPFNCMLREPGEPWVVASDGLRLLAMRASEAGSARPVAAFASRGRAEAAMEALVREEGLCPGLAGMEAVHPERGCFSHQLKRCDGVCVGALSLPAYKRRFRNAMTRLEKAHWPFPGAVGLVEARAGMRQVHVVDRWDYLGSFSGEDAGATRPYHGFDADVYRVVSRALAGGQVDYSCLPL